jgi:hypothetical protein
LFPICGILAEDAVGNPWNGGETFRIDILAAVDADPKRAIIQTVQGATHFTDKGKVAVKDADLQFPLLTVLDSVHLIGTRLNRKIRPVAGLLFQFRLSDFQNPSECVKFGIRHRLILTLSVPHRFAFSHRRIPQLAACSGVWDIDCNHNRTIAWMACRTH